MLILVILLPFRYPSNKLGEVTERMSEDRSRLVLTDEAYQGAYRLSSSSVTTAILFHMGKDRP